MCSTSMKFLSLVIPKKGVTKFRNWPRDLIDAPIGVKFSIPTKGFMQCTYQPRKFGVRSFYPFKSYGWVPNFKFRSRDSDHAQFRGQFVVRWLVHVTVNVCTKFEVSIFWSFQRYKGVPKFRNWSRDLIHAPLGVKFSYSDNGLHALY